MSTGGYSSKREGRAENDLRLYKRQSSTKFGVRGSTQSLEPDYLG